MKTKMEIALKQNLSVLLIGTLTGILQGLLMYAVYDGNLFALSLLFVGPIAYMWFVIRTYRDMAADEKYATLVAYCAERGIVLDTETYDYYYAVDGPRAAYKWLVGSING